MKKYLEKEKAIDTLARLYERIKREEHDQEAANGVWRAMEAIAALGDAWIPASERLRQPFPDSGIFQLPFLYEPNGSVEHSRKMQRAHGQQFKPIGNHTHIFKPPRRFRFLPEYFPLWYTF